VDANRVILDRRRGHYPLASFRATRLRQISRSYVTHKSPRCGRSDTLRRYQEAMRAFRPCFPPNGVFADRAFGIECFVSEFVDLCPYYRRRAELDLPPEGRHPIFDYQHQIISKKL
jgi:hypothetical protein